MRRDETERSSAAHDSLYDIILDQFTRREITQVIVHAVAVIFEQIEDWSTVTNVILRAAAQEHVIVHLLPAALVTVERM